MSARAPSSVDATLEDLGLGPATRASRVVSRILIGSFIALAILLVFVPWQQSVDGVGRVIAYAPQERQQLIEAPLEGRLVSKD